MKSQETLHCSSLNDLGCVAPFVYSLFKVIVLVFEPRIHKLH